jgi:hypothetical protein
MNLNNDKNSNSDNYTNLNLQCSNNNSPIKIRNNNNYNNNNLNNNISNNNNKEEKKDFNNMVISGGNFESFYKNEKNDKNIFGLRKNEFSAFGAYEKIKIQNDVNESMNNNKNNNYIDKSNKKELRYLQETLSSRNLKKIFSNFGKILQVPNKSMQEVLEEQRRKKNATEKCLSLYENGKIKNEVNRLMAIKNQKLKEEMELKECTFFPKTNFNEKFFGDKNLNNQIMKKLESNFFDRIISWQQKREKKYKKFFLFFYILINLGHKRKNII